MSNGLEGRGHASVGPLGSIALVRVIAQGDPYGMPLAYTTDYVVLETTLLLKSRLEAEAVKAMVDFLNRSGISILVVDEPIFRKALELLIEMPNALAYVIQPAWCSSRNSI